MERTTLKRRDKKWYIVSEYSLQDQPKIRRLWWRVTHGERVGALSDEHDGAKLFRHDTGMYTVLSPNGYTGYDHISVHIAPNAQAEIIDEIDYPCPKTRKGVETRYYYGTWQKYSKREGWINVANERRTSDGW